MTTEMFEGPDGLLYANPAECADAWAHEATSLRAALAEAAKYGFVQGYNAGYDDTVEGWYGYQEEKADEWYEDAEADGSLKEIIDAAMAREEG